MLKVTNNNDFDLNDRFDGTDYTFPAGKSVMLAQPAAKHIFGFGDDNKTPYLSRQGWLRTSGDTKEAHEKLNNFVFSDANVPVSGDVLDSDKEQQPALLQMVDSVELSSDGQGEAVSTTPIKAEDEDESILDKLKL